MHCRFLPFPSCSCCLPASCLLCGRLPHRAPLALPARPHADKTTLLLSRPTHKRCVVGSSPRHSFARPNRDLLLPRWRQRASTRQNNKSCASRSTHIVVEIRSTVLWAPFKPVEGEGGPHIPSVLRYFGTRNAHIVDHCQHRVPQQLTKSCICVPLCLRSTQRGRPRWSALIGVDLRSSPEREFPVLPIPRPKKKKKKIRANARKTNKQKKKHKNTPPKSTKTPKKAKTNKKTFRAYARN